MAAYDVASTIHQSLRVEHVGVGTMHRSALAPNGVIHLSRPVTAPFVDFQTSGGWRAGGLTLVQLSA